ncbi:hypothetical protein C8F04DRAFT_1185343 [Mycena alexandri]|uniref:Uncharacterized protein n=1 Tax=Mycena alexandri TaxID=1745969 RepID=A0AAD6X199_9AGAR|nr:hypothetical protein C8F04DRAFT_1185343 [Mycena alexandri]
MQRRGFALVDILNPQLETPTQALSGPRTNLVDVQPQLSRLAQISFGNSEVHAPLSVQQNLCVALEYLENQLPGLDCHRTGSIPDMSHEHHPPAIEIEIKRSTNVVINRQTTLETLYEYPRGYILEYPETSSTGCIGHLFHMDPNDWQDPTLNIAYSRGGCMGAESLGETFDAQGNEIQCFERHSTCEGSKICPNGNIDELSAPHTKASRADVQERLRKDREERLQYTSPSRHVFLKTLAYITAIQKLGCSRPLFEATGNFSATEEEMKDARELYLFQTQRGYRMTDGICEGRVVFDYGEDGRPYIRFMYSTVLMSAQFTVASIIIQKQTKIISMMVQSAMGPITLNTLKLYSAGMNRKRSRLRRPLSTLVTGP